MTKVLFFLLISSVASANCAVRTENVAPIKVAVIDTGSLDLSPGFDFILNKPFVSDDRVGHGTLINTILNEFPGPCSEAEGVRYQNQVYNYRYLDENFSEDVFKNLMGSYSQIKENKIRVVNLSSQFSFPTKSDYEKIKSMSDVLFVVAAGNDPEEEFYPCRYKTYPIFGEPLKNIICVGSMESGVIAQYSSSNSAVDFYEDGDYMGYKGTSYAAPKITRLVLLILNKYPDASNEEIKSILKKFTEYKLDPYLKTFYPYINANVLKSVLYLNKGE